MAEAAAMYDVADGPQYEQRNVTNPFEYMSPPLSISNGRPGGTPQNHQSTSEPAIWENPEPGRDGAAYDNSIRHRYMDVEGIYQRPIRRAPGRPRKNLDSVDPSKRNVSSRNSSDQDRYLRREELHRWSITRPPYKQRKIRSASRTKDDSSSHHPRNQEHETGVEELRRRNDKKLQGRLDSIFAKYGCDFGGISDEIDLVTGEVVVNNGHLRKMRHDRDIGNVQRHRLRREISEQADTSIDNEDELVTPSRRQLWSASPTSKSWIDSESSSPFNDNYDDRTTDLAAEVVHSAVPDQSRFDVTDSAFINKFNRNIVKEVTRVMQSFNRSRTDLRHASISRQQSRGLQSASALNANRTPSKRRLTPHRNFALYEGDLRRNSDYAAVQQRDYADPTGTPHLVTNTGDEPDQFSLDTSDDAWIDENAQDEFYNGMRVAASGQMQDNPTLPPGEDHFLNEGRDTSIGQSKHANAIFYPQAKPHSTSSIRFSGVAHSPSRRQTLPAESLSFRPRIEEEDQNLYSNIDPQLLFEGGRNSSIGVASPRRSREKSRPILVSDVQPDEREASKRLRTDTDYSRLHDTDKLDACKRFGLTYTIEEDDTIIHLREVRGYNWPRIAAIMKTRTVYALMKRYRKFLKPRFVIPTYREPSPELLGEGHSLHGNEGSFASTSQQHSISNQRPPFSCEADTQKNTNNVSEPAISEEIPRNIPFGHEDLLVNPSKDTSTKAKTRKRKWSSQHLLKSSTGGVSSVANKNSTSREKRVRSESRHNLSPAIVSGPSQEDSQNRTSPSWTPGAIGNVSERTGAANKVVESRSSKSVGKTLPLNSASPDRALRTETSGGSRPVSTYSKRRSKGRPEVARNPANPAASNTTVGAVQPPTKDRLFTPKTQQSASNGTHMESSARPNSARENVAAKHNKHTARTTQNTKPSTTSKAKPIRKESAPRMETPKPSCLERPYDDLGSEDELG